MVQKCSSTLSIIQNYSFSLKVACQPVSGNLEKKNGLQAQALPDEEKEVPEKVGKVF